MSDGIVCDVIVLTWNHLELTCKFFDSLLASAKPVIRVIVVDNGSTDGTKDYLDELKSRPGLACQIDVISNIENAGFVKGVNQGFALSSAPYVCLVNNDVIFTDGWLDEILGLFSKYRSIGILNPNSNTLGMATPKGRSLTDFAVELRSRSAGVFVEMPFCSGFCMVLRRDILDKNGGLSKDYIPMFFEDTDISMKAKALGYQIGVAKGAYVWHREHGSFKEGSEIDNIFKKSQQAFWKKWGKTLRIAWIVDNEKELLSDLRQIQKAGLQTHFVTLYCKGFDVKREQVFGKLNSFEHSAIQFKRFHMYVDLLFSLIFKKKKFDVVIVRNKFLYFILGVVRQKVSAGLDLTLVDDLKSAI